MPDEPPRFATEELARLVGELAEMRSVVSDLTDRVDAIERAGYAYVDPESNVRGFVDRETITLLKGLSGHTPRRSRR